MGINTQDDCKQASLETVLSKLAPREREITELALRSIASKDIAFQLNVSPSTVRSTLHRVYQKLDVSGLRELSQLVHEDLERDANGSTGVDAQRDRGDVIDSGRGIGGSGVSLSSKKIEPLMVPYALTMCGTLPLLAMFLVSPRFDVLEGTPFEWFGKLSACILGFLFAWRLNERFYGAGPIVSKTRLGMRIGFVGLVAVIVSAACWTYACSTESNGSSSIVVLLIRCVVYCTFACVLTFGICQLGRFRQLLLTSSASLMGACAFACLLLVFLAGKARLSYVIVLECILMAIVGISRIVYFRLSYLDVPTAPRVAFVGVHEALKVHSGLAVAFSVAGFMVTMQMSFQFDPIALACMVPYSAACLMGMVYCRRHKNWNLSVGAVVFALASAVLVLPTRQGFAISLALSSFLACLFMCWQARFTRTSCSVMVVATMVGACLGVVPSFIRGMVATLESGVILSLELYALIAMIVLSVSIIGCVAVWSIVQDCELRRVGERGRVTLNQGNDAERMRSYLIAKGLGNLEVEVVMSSLMGRTVQEIASEVHYSSSTIKAVRHGAFAQLGIAGVAELPLLFEQLNAL